MTVPAKMCCTMQCVHCHMRPLFIQRYCTHFIYQDIQHPDKVIYIALLTVLVWSIQCTNTGPSCVRGNVRVSTILCESERIRIPLQTLLRCREEVRKLFELSGDLELSMGMSSDYQHAVRQAVFMCLHIRNFHESTKSSKTCVFPCIFSI